jgi:hypothetical protein
MNRSTRNLLFLFFFLVPLLAAASDDQQKAHKTLNKVTAMSTDLSGKRAVSLAVSQYLSVSRAELAERRQALNVSYGDLFVVYELVKSGKKMDDIAARMKTGKTVWQIADEEHADWKQIANEAKKVNGKLDNNLLAHFASKKGEAELDKAEGYDPSVDTVAADNDLSKPEIEDAQARYLALRDRVTSGSGTNLNTSDENAARATRTDPVRTGGPTGPGNPPPAAASSPH